MATLRIYIGLPGSGKTTDAVAWVAESPDTRARINRDAIRAMMQGGQRGTSTQEKQATIVSHGAIAGLLTDGVDVACDDTNLDENRIRDLVGMARRLGANVEIVDMSTVPVETCIRQNEQRAGTPGYIDPEVITNMHKEHLASRGGVSLALAGLRRWPPAPVATIGYDQSVEHLRGRAEVDAALRRIAVMRGPRGHACVIHIAGGNVDDPWRHAELQVGLDPDTGRAFVAWTGEPAGHGYQLGVQPLDRPVAFDDDPDREPVLAGPDRTMVSVAAAYRAVQDYLVTGGRPRNLAWRAP